MENPAMTATPTDAEHATGRDIGNRFVPSAVIAQALADQRARYEAVADELTRLASDYEGTILAPSSAFRMAANRIRQVAR